MTTEERREVRQALLVRGFERTGYADDLSGRGDYIERWRHSDGTAIRLEWAERTQP